MRSTDIKRDEVTVDEIGGTCRMQSRNEKKLQKLYGKM
jgi:hypothetical protein